MENKSEHLTKNGIDYVALKRQMRSVIRMAKEVIEETERETPDDILIMDIAIEEMDELFEKISSTILRDGVAN